MQVNDSSPQPVSPGRISRRDFIKIGGALAAVLALPKQFGSDIARALAAGSRLPVVWLEFQDCTGDSESLLRAGHRPDPLQHTATQPSISELLLDLISLEYHETLMVPAGKRAEKSLTDVQANYPGGYLCVVEGSIPSADGGIYCMIRGKTALSIVQEVTAGAKAVVALGTCAWEGGLSAAVPDVTGAKGVKDVVPGLANLVALPGCPANVVNLVATIAYLITYNEAPARDGLGRPLFAYGDVVHEECEREDYYEEGKFVLQWGDEGHRSGWCLRGMGCKGPETHNNCSTVRWNEGVCWPVRAGHGCIGCSEPHFWDNKTPFHN